ncbi:MAG: hypothetical protein WBG92_23035 [Thiohalocapsa sp.]
MILKAIVDEQVYTLNVPDQIVRQGAAFFDQLDRDMDRGWQMSREWVDAPDRVQRCQIVADKLLSALEKENERLGVMMAGYIVARLPNVDAVEFDLQGEIQNNQFRFRGEPAEAPANASEQKAEAAPRPESDAAVAKPSGLTRLEAMAQAGEDVTKVFKVGKACRFSVLDHSSANWQDSPLIATEQEAERLRELAFKARYRALVGKPSD